MHKYCHKTPCVLTMVRTSHDNVIFVLYALPVPMMFIYIALLDYLIFIRVSGSYHLGMDIADVADMRHVSMRRKVGLCLHR
jgi:hypothetical protein